MCQTASGVKYLRRSAVRFQRPAARALLDIYIGKIALPVIKLHIIEMSDLDVLIKSVDPKPLESCELMNVYRSSGIFFSTRDCELYITPWVRGCPKRPTGRRNNLPIIGDSVTLA